MCLFRHDQIANKLTNKGIETEIKLRMIYQNEKGENLVFGQEGGQWKFIDSFFFHKIEYPI